MKKIIYLSLISVVFACGGPEPRKPIETKSGSFIKESVERNKRLLEEEEVLIQQYIAIDSIHDYQNSAAGSWYSYEIKNDEASYTPKEDDLVTLTYNLRSLNNDTIYSMEEVGVLNYKVDKQELFPGLRSGIKLLKEKETAIFIFPSSMAFGYHGDNNKIGPNTPIMATIEIFKITKKEDLIEIQN